MRYRYFIIPLIVLTAACNHAQKVKLTGDSTQITVKSSTVDRDSIAKTKNEPIAPALLILPGKSIGGTHLNENLDSVFAKLGRPDKGDAAMGASLNTWFAKHDTSGYQTDIYSHHNYNGKHDAISYVKIIRVTSPAFKTAGYLNTGTTLNNIGKNFKLSLTAIYFKGTDSLKIYDDMQQGIAFEINNAGKCKGIVVHIPGDNALATLSMHPDMQRADLKK